MSDWQSPGYTPPPHNNNAWSPGVQAPRPSDPLPNGGFQLMPLTVADVLDITFALFKKSWRKLIVASLPYTVVAGVLSGLTVLASGHDASFNSTGGFSALSSFNRTSDLSGARLALYGLANGLAILVAVFLKPYVSGAIVRLVAADYLGRDMAPKEAYAGLRPQYWSFIGAAILVDLCSGVGLIAFVIGIIPILVLFTVVTPIVAIESENASNALGRSWALMKRRFWTYLLIRIVIVLITVLASLAVQLIPTGLAFLFSYLGVDVLAALFTAVGAVLSSFITLPITMIAITLIYFDARVRNEGFDLQMMAARMPQASQPPTPPQQPPYQAPPHSGSGF